MNKVLSLIRSAVNSIRLLLDGPRESILPRKFYIDDSIFELEKKRIFNKLWLFIGLTNELPVSGCWIIKKVIHKEILIIRDGDTYHAHENVCPHKNMRLRSEKSGKGPLVCRYHAWSFKPDGSLAKIPDFDKSYMLTDRQLERACLTSFHIKKIGNFLFVCMDPKPISIETQFDAKIIRSLKLLSHRLTPEFGCFFETRGFNWKLNFENLRDALHPAVLHASTLAKEVDFSAQYVQLKPLQQALRRLDLVEASSLSKDGEHKTEKRGHLINLIDPSFGEGYYNWLLFPNFHMATPDGGRSYSIEVHNPLSPSQTEVSHFVIFSKPNNLDDVFLDEIVEHRLRGLRPVMGEDYEACEEIQVALQHTNREQNIGAYEHYNINIATMYRRLIGR